MGTPVRHSLDTHPGTTLRRVDWSKEIETPRRLFQDYRRWLAKHAGPPSALDSNAQIRLRMVDKLIAELPGAYGPPGGDVILAFAGGEVVACGALRGLEPKVGEIKRI